MVNKISHVCLVVSDLEKSVDFYKSKLGLKLKLKIGEYVEFKNKGSTLALLDEKVTGKTNLGTKGKFLSSPNSSRPMILAWDEVKDVDSLYRKLLGMGVEFVSKPQTMYWGQRVAYFSDPDGNIWEISTWVKKE